jgi:hydrogenase expression/formation protein HypC
MFLAIPGKVIEVFEDHGLRMARADFGGTVRKVCVEHLPDAGLGDYVLVHVGFALSKVDPEEAERTYRFLEELGQLDELQVPEAEA